MSSVSLRRLELRRTTSNLRVAANALLLNSLENEYCLPDAELFPGTLGLLILKAVSPGPQHGYGVLLRIQQIFVGITGPICARGLKQRIPIHLQARGHHKFSPDPGPSSPGSVAGDTIPWMATPHASIKQISAPESLGFDARRLARINLRCRRMSTQAISLASPRSSPAAAKSSTLTTAASVITPARSLSIPRPFFASTR